MSIFITVTLSLLEGLITTFKIFSLTLLMALPLGLIISFGSMTKFRPVKYLTKTKTGALIVFKKAMSSMAYSEVGTEINAKITANVKLSRNYFIRLIDGLLL